MAASVQEIMAVVAVILRVVKAEGILGEHGGTGTTVNV
jgi:hypothetical protein